MRKRAHITAFLSILAALAANAADAVFEDAVVVWHFDGANNSLQRFPVTIHGAVQVGVPLEGDDRAASLARGGDGKAARFDGGYIEIGGPAFDPPNSVFTLLLRLRDPWGAWNVPLFGSYGGDGAASLFLRGLDGASLPPRDRNHTGGQVATPAAWMFGWPEGPRAVAGSRGVLEFIWGAQGVNLTPGRIRMQPPNYPADDVPALAADTKNSIQRVMFPMQLAGPREWHDVIVRATGPKLELWIDGVLVDEEFPIGNTRPATVPRYFGAARLADGKMLAGFRGLMDHAALWHRALTEPEIAGLSGGASLAQQRRLAILGPLPERMQYFRPLGHNSKAGDCIPFFHDETFHLFYLVLRRNMHSKWDGGHGGLELHHASTRDLIGWQQHPVTVPISAQWEAWIGTGGVVHHNGKFKMFYPTPDYEGAHTGIQLTTSENGIHFTKQEPHPFLSGGDCDVFADPDPDKRLFHMLRSGPLVGGQLPALNDKTLVCWVKPTALDQRGGDVFTVEDSAGQFDSLTFGEVGSRRWLARSAAKYGAAQFPERNVEKATASRAWVQIAAVYSGNSVILYRNGTRDIYYDVEKPSRLAAGARIILGRRQPESRDNANACFEGVVADARLYGWALSGEQIAGLRQHVPAGPKPLVWFDFSSGGAADRTGTLAPAELEGDAPVRGGELVLDAEKRLVASGGQKRVMVRLVSEDLREWREQPEPLLMGDESLHPATCPHWFKWNDWYYFMGGTGIWKSRLPFGPWVQHAPSRIDTLAVPKTSAFTGNRRIMAGFMGDGGWGGNLVLRELVQSDDGALGTRFVPELVPASGEPVPIRLATGTNEVSRNRMVLNATDGRQTVDLLQVPADYRLQLEVVPASGVKSIGIALRAGATPSDNDCVLALSPGEQRVRFTKMTDSAGNYRSGPFIEGVEGLGRLVKLDIIVRHDLIDVEINGARALTNRYWAPRCDRLRFSVEGGSAEFRNIRVRPLQGGYEPYPGWKDAQPHGIQR